MRGPIVPGPATPGRGAGPGRLADLPPLPLTAERARPGEIQDAVWRALRSASRLAEADYGSQPADAPSASDILTTLCDAIRRAARAEDFGARGLPVGTAVQKLFTALRKHFLAELSHVSELLHAGEVVGALRAVDEVSRALETEHGRRAKRRILDAEPSELLVEVAHDMRSPLTSILFFVETLRGARSGPLNAVQDRQLGLVYSAAFALGSLANDLVDIAQGGERLLEGHPVPFSVAELFCSVSDLVMPVAEEKAIEVRLVPPDGDWRMGLAAALHRVLLNLATNALKFTSEGFVEVSARRVSRTAVEFSVTDTGRGMPAKVLASVRQQVAGAESPSETFTSAGLGLSICTRLVRSMGGELMIDPARKVGTRIYFTLDLPLAPRF